MAEVTQMRIKRGIIKGQITRLKNYFLKINEDSVNDNLIAELKNRLEKVEPLWDEFNDLQGQLEILNPSETDEAERDEFENDYFSITSRIRAFCSKLENQNVNSECNASIHSGIGTSVVKNDFIKLPTIKLISFNGNYSNWFEYRDAFTALVDNNQSLSDIQKFYYLRSSLEKEAAELIKSIEISAANYKCAWQLLIDRYENKNLMVHNHIKGIFDYPAINRESHTELRKLFDVVTKHLRALKILGEKTEHWDSLIIYIVTIKFDNITRRDWESFKYENDLPTMSDLNKYLKGKCEVLEKLEVSKIDRPRASTPQFRRRVSSNTLVANTNNSCYYCNQAHVIHKCNSFLKLPTNQRISTVKRLKLCLNCLQPSHYSWNCTVGKCSKCDKPHNFLLHIEAANGSNVKPETDKPSGGSASGKAQEPQLAIDTQTIEETERVSVNNHVLECNFSKRSMPFSQVLLSTAIIKVLNRENKFITCRALLDSGSQSCFVTEKLRKELNLESTKINHEVRGLGQGVSQINNQVKLLIKSCYNNFNLTINCLEIPKITERIPSISFDRNLIVIPANSRLADPTFNVSNDIDILLGSNVFWSILCNGQMKLGKNMPTLQNSKFGWIIAGNLCINLNPNKSITCLALTNEDLSTDNKIEKFWQIEEIHNNNSLLSPSEKYCETHFEKTTRRDCNGRFVISIPFKESLRELGNSKEVALNRFYALERKLNKNPELKTDYAQFMQEYESLNHMSEINSLNKYDSNTDGFYLPHHAVIKTTSLTTKCRVVFDASAKTDTGLSLNDVQFTGPTLQQDVFSILARFRMHKIVITADISKMYRQVLISEDQRKYQKIFWRPNSDSKLKCYQLNTLTYGTACAPYLAVRCLVQLAKENETQFPTVSKIIRNDFYVDDLITGAETVAEVQKIQQEISCLLSGAGFELRKWLCNDLSAVKNFKLNDNLEASILEIGENESNKTLGIYWNPEVDCIQYSTGVLNADSVTKRSILSIICQIFDPLGLLGPIITVAKLIMQELWKLKLSWDDNVPQDLYTKWLRFKEELSVINKFQIPRHCMISKYVSIELHGFSDASERAYGACLYIRCSLNSTSFSSSLLCAKSRVAPLKQISLPRLELSAALLLANLVKKVTEAMQFNFDNKFFWTDSLITLAWIRSAPNRWKTFVANRVSEIQSITDICNWGYVRSNENPADLLSRGVSPNHLDASILWWKGPEWLCKNNSEWVMLQQPASRVLDIPEERSNSNTYIITVSSDQLNVINKFSSLIKLKRVVAYILRFIENSRLSPTQRKFGELSPMELNNSLNRLIRVIQIENFPEDYNRLQNNRELKAKSKILSLNPFMKDGLIRVGGRLMNSNECYNKKHPILLPKSNTLTNLILEHEHERLLHCGSQCLLAAVRERFWPISGRSICKNIIRKCITCFKARPSNYNYLMGNLPEIRVQSHAPFVNVGVDYGGPVLLKDRTTRGAKIIKAYFCLLICMSTKAVHIELVAELTTKAFMATLKRFISRRGKPKNIYSDNGLNFVGANNELRQLYEFLETDTNQITKLLADDKIVWHFAPARSPSFGGIYEGGIKSTKHHIKRVIGNKHLTFEEYCTVLTQIEGVLNSRPLCPLSSDPEDLEALTPGHFLIGRSLTALPEDNIMEIAENRLESYQKLQYMVQHYWARWHKEYLSELQLRTKWKQRSQDVLKVGTLVLIKDDNASPLQWKMGRVTQLHPGNDGVVRVVDIKVRSGIIQRAVNRVCALPVD